MIVHIPRPLAEKADELASCLDRPRGRVVRQALSTWVEQQDERHRMTLEAMANLEANEVIDHTAVHAWADSLNTNVELPVPS